MKYWTSTQKGDDAIIAYVNKTIYKANPPINEIDQYVLDLKTENFSSHYFFGIPLHYITQINQEENKNYIEILFRGDTEHLTIADDKKRTELFEFFKENIPGSSFSVVKQSKIQAVKKPLIASIVVVLLFSWSFYIAIGMESGNQYDVTGQQYHSIAGIVLVLAALGTTKLLFIFGTLLAIIGFAIYKKYNNPIVKSTLSIKH